MSGEIEQQNSEKINDKESENSGKKQNNNKKINIQKIFIICLTIAVIALAVIIEDEFSGKNRLDSFFTSLQKKIIALINHDEDSKNYQNYLHSLNLSKNTETNKEDTKILDESVLNVYEDKNVAKEKNKQLVTDNNGSYRDIIDYEYMNEEQLIEAIDKDFQSDCNFYNQDSRVSSVVVKPFVTKIAIDKGYDNLMDKLCRMEYHPKDDTSRFNALNTLPYATEQNSRKCIDILVKNGADLSVEQEGGKNLLHSAAQSGNILFAKKLLKYGIPVDKETNDNKTPLYYAIKNNKYEMAFFLTNCGSKDNEKLKAETRDYNMLKFLETGKPVWREKVVPLEDSEWKEAYEYIVQGKLKELQELVKNGKDLSKMVVDGEPAPCIAVYYNQYEILNYLIHQYDCKSLIDSKTGRNALHYAVKQSNAKMVDLLIQKDFDINSFDLYDYTPLHHAVYNSTPECLVSLLHNGADPDRVNLKKQTPLHLAVLAKNLLGIKLLLEEGANINAQDLDGNSVLHYVAQNPSNKALLDVLYEYDNRFNFNLKNKEGKTPKELDQWGRFNSYEKNRF